MAGRLFSPMRTIPFATTFSSSLQPSIFSRSFSSTQLLRSQESIIPVLEPVSEKKESGRIV